MEATDDVFFVLANGFISEVNLPHLFLKLCDLLLFRLNFLLSFLYLAFVLVHEIGNLSIELGDLSDVPFVQLTHALKHGHSDLLVLCSIFFADLRNFHELIYHGLFICQLSLQVYDLLSLLVYVLAILLAERCKGFFKFHLLLVVGGCVLFVQLLNLLLEILFGFEIRLSHV